MIHETTERPPVVIMTFGHGYCLVKFPGLRPYFEVRLGSGTNADVLMRIDHIDIMAKHLYRHGYVNSIQDGLILLNQEGANNA